MGKLSWKPYSAQKYATSVPSPAARLRYASRVRWLRQRSTRRGLPLVCFQSSGSRSSNSARIGRCQLKKRLAASSGRRARLSSITGVISSNEFLIRGFRQGGRPESSSLPAEPRESAHGATPELKLPAGAGSTVFQNLDI